MIEKSAEKQKGVEEVEVTEEITDQEEDEN